MLQWVLRSMFSTVLRTSASSSVKSAGVEVVMWWHRRSSRSCTTLMKSFGMLNMGG